MGEEIVRLPPETTGQVNPLVAGSSPARPTNRVLTGEQNRTLQALLRTRYRRRVRARAPARHCIPTRLLDGSRPGEALICFERFLVMLRAEPWRKHLLWLAFSVYTLDAEAMALNDIGAAHLTLAQF